MKKFMRLRQGFFLCILTLLLVVLVDPVIAASDEPVVIQVAYPLVSGFSMIDDNGKPYGLVVDFLNEIAQYTGWEYEYTVDTAITLLDEFEEGKYDLMGTAYYSPVLEAFYAYPDYNTGYSKSVLLARRDDPTITGYNLNDLNGKTIGVHARAEENIRRMKEFLSMNGLDCTIRAYTVDQVGDNLYPFLENGEVDLILGNAGDDTGIFRSVAYFDSQPHYIVTTKDNKKVLDGLNFALQQIYESNPSFAQERYATYFPEMNAEVSLSEEEKAYVIEKNTVKVAVPQEFHPFFCINNDESHNGIVPDILAQVTAFSGLNFEYIYADTYPQALDMVRQGEVDMAGFFLDSRLEAAEAGISLSHSYVTMNNLIVRHKSVSYPTKGLTFGILKGQELRADLEAGDIRYFDNIHDGLAAVDKGEIDGFYGVSACIEYGLQRNSFYNVAPVSLFDDSTEIGFALVKPVNSCLLTILNKTITNMTDGNLSAIANQNIISVGISKMTFKDLLYSYPIQVICVCLIVFLLVVAVIILVTGSRVKAAVMRSNLEKAEANSRAKSEFLSRMSHEIRTPMNAILGLSELTSRIQGLPEEAQLNLSKLRSSSQYLLSLINDILDMSRIDSNKMSLAAETFYLTQTLDEIKSMMESEAGRHGLEFSVVTKVEHPGLIGDATRLRQVLTNLLSNAIKFTDAGGKVSLSVTETEADDKGATFLFQVMDNGTGIPKEDQTRIFAAFEQSGNGLTRSKGTGLGLPISHSIVQLMGGTLQLKSEVDKGSEFFFEIYMPYGTPKSEGEESNTELLTGVRLLLAEDNELNAEIAIQLLQMQGAQVALASNGKIAIEMFSASAPGEYQAILMDLQMPVIDGLAATRTIRSLNHPDAYIIPIIALTANSFQEDIDAAMEAGMNGFVSKPLDVNYLFSTLRSVL